MPHGFYAVCVASDVDGDKLNLEFHFDSYAPSVAQLLGRASTAYNNIFQTRNIDKAFALSSAVIYDEAISHWLPLERSSQLQHNCQVYLFQPDVVDFPAEISDPVSGEQFLAEYQSPQRYHNSNQNLHQYNKIDAAVSPRASMPARLGPRQPGGTLYDSPAALQQQQKQRSRSPSQPKSEERKKYIEEIRKQVMNERSKELAEAAAGGAKPRSIQKEEQQKLEELDKLPYDEYKKALRQDLDEFEKNVSLPQEQQS